MLHSQRALILLRQGETAAALDAFDVGIAMLTDPVELGKAHINRGASTWPAVPGPARPRTSSSRCGSLREQGNEIEAAMAEHNLGYADLLQGDLVSALDHMDAVRPVLLPQSQVVVAICNQDRAEVLMAAGLTRSGPGRPRRGRRERSAQHRLAQRRGEAELTIARAALGHRPSPRARGRARRQVAVHPDARSGPARARRGAGARRRGHGWAGPGPSLITRAGCPRRRARRGWRCRGGRSTPGSTQR